MLKVGLTGGIGCGKTTVAKLFAELGIPVIDADEIAHALVAPGQPALLRIQRAFGGRVINADGALNRKNLRELVFSDAERKRELEAILHPLIYETIQTKLAQLNTAYCIICIPLLFETQMTGFVQRILVIDCPVNLQIERVRQRDNLTSETILAIIESQVSRAFRKAHADDLIDNSKTDDGLAVQVKKLHNLYLSLSSS